MEPKIALYFENYIHTLYSPFTRSQLRSWYNSKEFKSSYFAKGEKLKYLA